MPQPEAAQGGAQARSQARSQAHNQAQEAEGYIWLVTTDGPIEAGTMPVPLLPTAEPSAEPSYRIGKGGPALGQPGSQVGQAPIGQPTLGGISQMPTAGPRPVQVEQRTLERGMTQFLSVIGRVLNRAQAASPDLGDMVLDEIELAIEISGEGEVRLLGSGGKAGSKGTMTLTFRRSAAGA